MREDHAASGLPDESQARLYDQAFHGARIGAPEGELATARLSWTHGVFDIFGVSTGDPLRRASIVDLHIDESRRNRELARAEGGTWRRSCGRCPATSGTVLATALRLDHGTVVHGGCEGGFGPAS